MESAIVQNQNYFTYWMNFDNFADLIPLILWFMGILFVSASVVMMQSGSLVDDEIEVYGIEDEVNIGLLQRIEQR